MRALDHIKLANKEIIRRPVRSALTLTALAISAIILVTLASLSFGAQQAIVGTISPNNSLQTITVTPNTASAPGLFFGSVQESKPQANKLNDEALQKMSTIPGVSNVQPRAHIWEFNTFTIGESSKQFVAQTEGVPANDTALPLSAGRQFTSDNEVIVGLAYAKELGKSPTDLLGQMVTITTQKGYRGVGAIIPAVGATPASIDQFNAEPTQIMATIVGVTTEGANQNSMFIPHTWARDIRTARYAEALGVKKIDQFAESGYTSAVITVADSAIVEAVEKEINTFGYGSSSAFSIVKQWLSLSTALWVILGAVAIVALLAASLGIINTMLVAVSEQRTSIGVWRAFGATKSHVALQFLLQAIIIGCLGGAAGVAVGLAVSYFVNQHVAHLLQVGNLQPIAPAQTPLWLLITCFGLVVAFSILAGLYPALRAANQDPAKNLNANG